MGPLRWGQHPGNAQTGVCFPSKRDGCSDPSPFPDPSSSFPALKPTRVYEGDLQPQRARLSSEPAAIQSPSAAPEPPGKSPPAPGRRGRAEPNLAGSAPQRCPPPAVPHTAVPPQPLTLPSPPQPPAPPAPHAAVRSQPFSAALTLQSLSAAMVPLLRGTNASGGGAVTGSSSGPWLAGMRGASAPPRRDVGGSSVAFIAPQIFVPSSGPTSGPRCPRLNSVLTRCSPEGVAVPSGCCSSRWATPTSSVRQAASPAPRPLWPRWPRSCFFFCSCSPAAAGARRLPLSVSSRHPCGSAARALTVKSSSGRTTSTRCRACGTAP